MNQITNDPFNWPTKEKCHDGMTLIFQHKNGRGLYIGGWTTGAKFDHKTFVIDLTGLEHKYWDIAFAYTPNANDFLPFVNTSYGRWLSLPFPDYGVPSGLKSLRQWQGITKTIKDTLNKGMDVLVACHGGHGRSGLFVAIVGYLLNIKTDKSRASPVEKVRTIHCENSVETFQQEKFVYTILGLDVEIKHIYTQPTVSSKTPRFNQFGELCPICGSLSYQLESYGMCGACSAKYGDAETRSDLTLADIDSQIGKHTCTHGNKCVGIWKAEKCGHITHDMIVYDGLCEVCWNKEQDEKEYAEKALSKQGEQVPGWKEPCAMCGLVSHFSENIGVTCM